MKTKTEVTVERLLFLANVVKRELKHLQATDKRLFSNPLTLATIEQLENDEVICQQ